jgi:hypothetical protein
VRVVLSLLCGACGRIGFDAPADTAFDSPVDAADPCPATISLDEHFPPGSIDTSRWMYQTNPSFTFTQNNGLTMAFAANVPPGQLASLIEVASHDAHGACLTASVLAIPAVQHAYCDIGWRTPTANQITWSVSFSGLEATGYVSATMTPSTFHSAPFDPIAHKFLRLREAAGTYTFETSATGDVFVPFATTSGQQAFDPTTSLVQILCASDSSSAAVNAGNTVVGFATQVVR